MKTLALRLAVSLLLIQPLVGPAAAQSVDDVVEKHLAALGGRDALAKLTTRTTTGTLSIVTPAGTFPGSIETYSMAPNKVRSYMRLDLSAAGAGEMIIEQKFDGMTGIAMNSLQGNTEITGNPLENMRNNVFPSSLLRYKEAGSKAELLPKEKVGDRDAIVLLLTPRTGSPVRYYIDAETWVIARTVTKVNAPQLGGEIEQTSDFTDYRIVDGVKTPFQVVNANPAQTVTITLTKVEHNVALDAAMFAKK